MCHKALESSEKIDLLSNRISSSQERQCQRMQSSGWQSKPGCCYSIIIKTSARFLSLARSKLRLCSANHSAGCFSNLAYDWLSLGLTPRKRQKTGPDINNLWYNRRMNSTRHTDNSKIEVKDYQYHHCDIKCIIFDMQNADHFSKYLTKTYQRIRIVQIAIAYIVILFHVKTTLKSVWWGIDIFT